MIRGRDIPSNNQRKVTINDPSRKYRKYGTEGIKTAVPYFFPWRLFLRNKQFLGHNPTIFCRIPCVLCISHLCTLHFCPGSGYTDINRHQIQRGNYENKKKLPKTVRIIPATIDTKAAITQSYRQLRVAAYCRVSTKQDEQLNNYEVQRTHYEERIRTEPKWSLVGIFADNADGINEERITELMNEKQRLTVQLKQYATMRQKRESAKSRLDEIFTILDGLQNHLMKYDDDVFKYIVQFNDEYCIDAFAKGISFALNFKEQAERFMNKKYDY